MRNPATSGTLALDDLRLDCAAKQKKGLHFILASVLIWCAVFVVSLTSLPILSKNFLTFCCTAPLVPLSYLIAKRIGVDFDDRENPLSRLGFLFSLNQLLYLLIAIWVYPTVPEKLVMVLAIIFGAHLLPFGWLYVSRSYMIMSVVVSIAALTLGWNGQPALVAGAMIGFEVVFCLLLVNEVRASAKPHVQEVSQEG